MRHLRIILVFTAMAFVTTLPITGIRLPPNVTAAVGFVAGMVAFVSALYAGYSLVGAERWVPCALVAIVAGAIGGTEWWAIAARDQSLAASALGGGFAGFALFLPDSWVVGRR